MEASSPLAAMQPPTLPGPFGRGCRQDLDSCFWKHRSFEPNFNFRDLSMGKPKSLQAHPDYFSFNPVRGSSPTASLAADLSQNFHIDKSPQLPTPRRSLFTGSSLFDLKHGRNAITPPILSSSPGPDNDTMEVSPLLPHKVPYAATVQIEVSSPTPEPTPTAEDAKSGMEANLALFEPLRRRKPSASRPVLRKNLSTSSVSLDTHSQLADPPFQFGTRPAPLSQQTLETFFEASPEQPKSLHPSVSSSALLPCTKPYFLSNGSPVNPIRRATGPAARGSRVGLSRRSQSMYASNGMSAMRQEKRCCTSAGLQAVMDLVDDYVPKLPHFLPENEPDGLPRITKETLVNMIDGAHGQEACKPTIIDCRFEFEFSGGHIEGAVNFNDKEQLARQLFEQPSTEQKILIFHCEYSALRAPTMAKFIRQRDRSVNDFQYPKLTYPEIYILDGGYHSFFTVHRSRCYPQNYVSMDAQEHESDCERGMAKVRQRRKLSRAQTYAFGQSSCGTQEQLPTLSSMDTSDSMDIDILPIRPPSLQRRMGSY